MPLHSLEEVPMRPREYLVIEHGDKDLICKAGNYQEIENWLAGELVHTRWVTIMKNIADCKTSGQFVRLSLGRNNIKTAIIIRIWRGD